MRGEWSAQCGADDPVLVVPWSDPEDPTGNCRFVDLREHPYDLELIPEAELHPPLMQALRALNGGRSPVFTAKCDAWEMDAEELLAFHSHLDLPPAEAPFGFMSYLDVLWRERALFVSLHHQQQRLDRLIRLLDPLDQPYAAVECVLRSALVDLISPQEGFAISLYVKALGSDRAEAYLHWSLALEAVVGMVRGKDLSFA